MKNVMISIKPKWCELIAEGKKTIEVRKTRPKCETPFKCYIYCTKNNKRGISAYESAYLNGNGDVKNGSGKVIGEFVVDELCNITREIIDMGDYPPSYFHEWVVDGHDYYDVDPCDELELDDYAKGESMLYGWHISNLRIYDEPMEIEDFGLERAPQSWCYCEELTDDLDEWELDPCYECTGLGDDYSYDEEQDELVSNCADCPHNRRDD